MVTFSAEQLEIVRFCAIECELQVSGERSVWWMVEAWQHALDHSADLPTEDDVLRLGSMVEPNRNARGYRQVGVRVGSDVKGDWRLVPRKMESLMRNAGDITPEEFFHNYEECHPFVDGNGRTGQILYNWLAGSLEGPRWAPNLWNDARRHPGSGAP